MPNPTPDSYVFTPGVTLYVGMPTPGGSLLTTLTLVNTSGSEQAANFVAPMFGQPFVQGDVPSGQYPAFELTDGTPCPATIHSVTTWPDGSMKWCGVLMRVPTTIAGSGSLTINVKNGGSAPSASSRTTGDLTAADLSTVLTGVTNLTGEWTASLNTAITDATDIVSLGDGPAGRIWRIGGPFKQSGSPHGQLHCWHYVAALQNSSGGLLGLRYLGRAAQPWADVSSPTPTRRVLTAVLKSGASTLRSLQGHDTTETPGSNIGMAHYTSFFTAGTDGKWDFVQGGGSASADCTVRVQHDKTYFVKSRLVPPYDLTVEPTSSSSVDYRPYGRGPMQRDVGGTGERDDIGILTSWAARHLLTQAAVDERVIRVVGLCSAGWRQLTRRSTTKQIVPCTDPAASYTGLGTIQTTWRVRPGLNSGAVAPSVETSMWLSEFEPSHRPNATYYPYLVTGEPQYLDLMVEQANGLLLSAVPGSSSMNTATTLTKSTLRTNSDFGDRDVVIGGTTYKGGGYWFTDGLLRVPAWGTRDIAQAAAVYPDTCPWGTETRKYLRDVMAALYTSANVYNNARAQAWRDSGMFNFDSRDGSEAPWCHAYMSLSICHQANILPSTDAATFRAHIGRYWSRAEELMDIGCAMAYTALHYDESGNRVEDMEDMVFEVGSTLTFSTSTNRATVSGNPGSWVPTNGDVFAFSSFRDADKPFSEATDYRRLYAANCSSNTFQLSATPGGSVITVTSNAVVTGFYCRLANFAPHYSFENVSSPAAYVSNIRGSIRMHEASGDSFINAARVDADARLVTAGVTFTSDPKNAFAAAYPS